MRAAIAGDIIGSRFERSVWSGDRLADARCTGYDRPPTVDAVGETATGFELFHPGCHATDDSVLTVAVMDWLLYGGDLTTVYRTHFRRCGCQDRFGKFFRAWAERDTDEPCGSFGNGAAMRVSPVGFAADDADTVVRLARETAAPTHNTPDAVAGAGGGRPRHIPRPDRNLEGRLGGRNRRPIRVRPFPQS